MRSVFFREPAIREVYVVPNFISEGYFTRTVIPRELELTGAETERPNGQIWKYCEPVGNHDSMTHICSSARARLRPECRKRKPAFSSSAHGTSLNDNSAVAAKEQAEENPRAGPICGRVERLHGRTAARL